MFLKLPFYNPQITFKDVIGSFFLKNPKEKLENQLQNYFNSVNILLLKSGRQGIKFILESLNLTEKDEVIVPSFICSVVPHAVIKARATPVFCGPEKDGFNIDIETAKKLITSKTKVIIVPHLFGIPTKIDEWVKLCKKNNLFLIEDCAHSFGAKYKEKLLGTFGDFAIFSFGISKNFGGLGGGFLYCRDKENFQKIKKITSKTKRKNFSFKKYFEFCLIPLIFNRYFYWLFSNFIEKYARIKRDKESDKEFTSSLSNLEAKVAFLKLRRYEKNRKKRNRNTFIYQKELKDFFSFPIISTNSLPTYPYFPVLASQEVFNILSIQNIPVQRIGFGELNKDRQFESFKFNNPNEKEIQKKYFLLPLNYPSKDIRLIAQQIKEILINHAK